MKYIALIFFFRLCKELPNSKGNSLPFAKADRRSQFLYSSRRKGLRLVDERYETCGESGTAIPCILHNN
jgi:hypothetical protein